MMPTLPPVAEMRDDHDEGATRHGRERHAGFPVGRYLQAPPFFFTRDKHPAPLVDMYRGLSAFLIAGGPSFATIDHAKLREPGILTLGLNNSVKTFRPNLWTSVDDPSNFIRSTWLDPTIAKFVPISHIDKPLFDSDAWRFLDVRVGDCPNVWYFKRNERFKADQYLWEDSINWGNSKHNGGGRSILLAGVRILFLLGVRRIFLLGVDLDMSPEKRYHFEQDRAAGSIRGNNSTYRLLQSRFTELRPHFEEAGLNVFNCNPASKLTAFDHMPFDEALALARHANFPADVKAERTAGLYDRRANEEAARRQQAERRAKMPAMPVATAGPATLREIRRQVDEARTVLHAAKARAEQYAGSESPNPRKLAQMKRVESDARKVFRHLVAIREGMSR